MMQQKSRTLLSSNELHSFHLSIGRVRNCYKNTNMCFPCSWFPLNFILFCIHVNEIKTITVDSLCSFCPTITGPSLSQWYHLSGYRDNHHKYWTVGRPSCLYNGNPYTHGRPTGLSLHWRHNERDGISIQRHVDCLITRLLRRRLKNESPASLRSNLTGVFPSQRANNVKNVSIWWRHHVPPVCEMCIFKVFIFMYEHI